MVFERCEVVDEGDVRRDHLGRASGRFADRRGKSPVEKVFSGGILLACLRHNNKAISHCNLAEHRCFVVKYYLKKKKPILLHFPNIW